MDLISRQAAISLPVKPKEDRYFQTQNLDDAYDYGWYSLQGCIEKLPSAQSERKKGKWYKPTGMMPPEHFGRHRCSECERFALHDWKHHKEQLTDFCPNCGADMREVTNEETAKS